MTAKKSGMKEKVKSLASRPAMGGGTSGADQLQSARRPAPPSPARYENRPGFESAARTAAAPSPAKKETRGGARPGAGRPLGVDDDLSRVNKLPERANVQIVPILQMPFSFWAKRTGVRELALSDKEGEELALPVYQLLCYYFPDKIPEIAWVWLNFSGITIRIMDSRLDLLAQKRAEKQDHSSIPARSSAGSMARGAAAASAPGGAPPISNVVTIEDIERAAQPIM